MYYYTIQYAKSQCLYIFLLYTQGAVKDRRKNSGRDNSQPLLYYVLSVFLTYSAILAEISSETPLGSSSGSAR